MRREAPSSDVGAGHGAAQLPLERALIDRRVLLICACSVVLAVATGFIAQALVVLIGIITF